MSWWRFDATHIGGQPEHAAPALPHVEGASAEQLQQPRVREQAGGAYFGDAVGEWSHPKPGANTSSADLRTPQAFPTRPSIVHVTPEADVGVDTALLRLPGRQPPTGWDGELDATSPLADQGGP